MRYGRFLPLLFTAIGSTAMAAAGTVTVVTQESRFNAQPYAGSSFRQQVDAALTSGDGRTILRNLRPVLDWCDARIAAPGVVHASVSTKDEQRAFAAAQAPDANIDFIDIACPRAWLAAGFTQIDLGDKASAAALLERAATIAPYWAEPLTERAFLLNSQGDRQHALALYQHAAELARQWPGSHSSLAVALRGIGWTLVELGDYAGARTAYQQSLQIDPGNTLAANELEFIGEHEHTGSPETPAYDTAVAQDAAAVAQRQFMIDVQSLEKLPLLDSSTATRSRLLKWLAATPDATVVACDLLQLGSGKAHFQAQWQAQYLLGAGAYLLQSSTRGNTFTAVQLAGVRSALRAYRIALAARPELRIARMDLLVRHDDDGDLGTFLADPIDQCKATAPTRSN